MKKLIALSLAAASSLVISSNAMALPARFGQAITIQVDGAQAQPTTCYLVRNIDGVSGQCQYACEEQGPSPNSPTLPLSLFEQKVAPFTNCWTNSMVIVPTLLRIAQGSMILDQFGFPSVVGNLCMGQEGGILACILDGYGALLPVSVRA